MTPRKTDQAQIAFLCPLEMAAKLRALSERTMIPQSKLLRKALELLFDEYPEGKPPTGGKGRKTGGIEPSWARIRSASTWPAKVYQILPELGEWRQPPAQCERASPNNDLDGKSARSVSSTAVDPNSSFAKTLLDERSRIVLRVGVVCPGRINEQTRTWRVGLDKVKHHVPVTGPEGVQ